MFFNSNSSLTAISLFIGLLLPIQETRSQPTPSESPSAEVETQSYEVYQEFLSLIRRFVNSSGEYYISYSNQFIATNEPSLSRSYTTELWQEKNQARLDIPIKNQEHRMYQIGDQVTVCVPNNHKFRCSTQTSQNNYQLREFALGSEMWSDLAQEKEPYNFNVIKLEGKQIAGETATCFIVFDFEFDDQARLSTCFSDNYGIPLSVEAIMAEGERIIKATNFKSSVDESVFSLPEQALTE